MMISNVLQLMDRWLFMWGPIKYDYSFRAWKVLSHCLCVLITLSCAMTIQTSHLYSFTKVIKFIAYIYFVKTVYTPIGKLCFISQTVDVKIMFTHFNIIIQLPQQSIHHKLIPYSVKYWRMYVISQHELGICLHIS